MRKTSLIPTTPKPLKVPKRNDERVILHFDYDCFYASVFENENPSLKSQPLGVKQKSILATCNYMARARGVKKLMLISEAQKICPDLVLMNGEDLTRFRDVSKKLWAFLRAHSWNRRVERLGLDEAFLDVTDMIAYNQEMLNVHALKASFFQLDRSDPVKGFAFDGTRFCGCVQPAPNDPKANGMSEVNVGNPLCVRLMLASHLAGYLRHKLDEDFGYTSSSGISTNKVLAKLAGSANKPNNQTTLLGVDDAAVQGFMDAHPIRKVPGIGSRVAQLIEQHILSVPTALRDREGTLTVSEVRGHAGLSPELLEQILDRPGAERGSGEKIWNLLHGVDASEVKEASDVPTQISIEDTYMSRPLQTPAEIMRELRALASSLVRRMRVDLTEAADPQHQHHHTPSNVPVTMSSRSASPTPASAGSSAPPRWLAYPKTLRLATRTKPRPSAPSSTSSGSAADAPTFSRSSRSAPLPSFIFNFSSHASSSEDIAGIAERLVTESLLPLFRRLHPERGGWNLALLNICVTNMVMVASADDSSSGGKGAGAAAAAGRHIGRMFRMQEDKLREWTVYDTSSSSSSLPGPSSVHTEEYVKEDVEENEEVDLSSPLGDEVDDAWEEQEESNSQLCDVCGHAIPAFAISAHERFHAMDD
ncbi:hypothetical protein F5Y19DRAFT_470218 [Xylariaceae sp. FL1651]|nr:hypothetical protein F5Y19DRAFT_470218 [Xylariaceae sp. FL1651]